LVFGRECILEIFLEALPVKNYRSIQEVGVERVYNTNKAKNAWG